MSSEAGSVEEEEVGVVFGTVRADVEEEAEAGLGVSQTTQEGSEAGLTSVHVGHGQSSIVVGKQGAVVVECPRKSMD